MYSLGGLKGDIYPFGKVLLKITQDRRVKSQVALKTATRLADWLALSFRLGERHHIMLSPVGRPLQILMRVENQQGAEQGATGMSICSFLLSFTYSFIHSFINLMSS